MAEKGQKKRFRGHKILLTALVALVLIVVVAVILLRHVLNNAMPGEVADYDTRIEIWPSAAGNNRRSKLDDMNIDDGGNLLFSTIEFVQAIVRDEYTDTEQVIDTFTYLYEIKGGYEKETYEDAPYLIPYVTEGAKTAVIVIPGGGFGYKSMDGTTGEGRDVAQTLNERGISAFVLHYRSNPYEYPIPLLDVQRAVRYLRANAEAFGIDPDRIGLIGFSAGGFEVGGFINLVRNRDLFPKDYVRDEIDSIDDSVSFAGMVYPALTFDYNVPMLFAIFDAENVRNEAKRQELLDLVDLKQHISSSDIPQFVCYGTKDNMVKSTGIFEYVAAARDAGASVTLTMAEGQDHGFGVDFYMDDYIQWIDSVAAEK